MSGESNQNMNQSNRNDRCPCCIPWRSAVPRRPNTNTSSTSQSAPSIDFGNFYVLRNANVWTLEKNTDSSSVLDIWVSNGKIVSMTPPSAARSMCPSIPGLKEIDMRGLDIVPGFVDIHVHAIGGGGEDSFGSRTPEACLEELVEAGVTTFVGILGTDTVGRNMESLIAKTRALSEKGLTGRVWLGGYAFPIENTVTGSVRKDLTILPDVIGVGELAISDHRSSFPTTDDLLKLCSEVRVAGMVSGNAGVTYFHMGDNDTALQPLVEVVKRNPVLQTYLVPTHMERTPTLIQQGKAWMQAGGFVDFSCWPERQRDAIRQYLEDNEDGEALIREKLSISSDSYGSISVFDDNGTIVDSTYGKPKTLLETFMALVYKDGVSINTALRFFCQNPAKVIRMDRMPMNKGKICVGSDADFLVLKLPANPLPLNYTCKIAHGMSWPSTDGILQYVIASGKVMKCPRNTSGRGQVMASQSQISQTMRSTTQARVGEIGRSTLPLLKHREQAKKQASSTSRRPVAVAQIAYGKDSSIGPHIAQVSKEVINKEVRLSNASVAQDKTTANLEVPSDLPGLGPISPEMTQKRGRGRPRKDASITSSTSKSVSTANERGGQQSQIAKKRGRPRKDSSLPPQSTNKRGRGRPRKDASVDSTGSKAATPIIGGEGQQPAKKRGRPRKDALIDTVSKTAATPTNGGEGQQSAKKRGRGRPRKDASVDTVSKTATPVNGGERQHPQPAKKRGRGRPRKDASVDTVSKTATPTNGGEGHQPQPAKDASIDSTGSKAATPTNGGEGQQQQQQPAEEHGEDRSGKENASIDSTGSKAATPTNGGEGQQQQQPAKEHGGENASPNENSLPMLSKIGDAEHQSHSENDTFITAVEDSSAPSNGDELQPPQPTTESSVTTEQKSLTNLKGNEEKSPQSDKKHGRGRSGKKSPLIYLF